MAFARPKPRRLAWLVALSAVTFTCLALASSIPPSARAADEAAWLYNPGQVVEINLELTQAKLEKLEEEPDEYQKGTFELEVNGVPVEPPIEASIKLKGQKGSFRPLTQKAAFKLKFPKSGPFFGLRKMTLNNMVQDPSMIHETLAYEMFRAFGVPASRTGYAVVHLHGVNYGVHLNLETLDEVSLARLFGPSETQHLYEADAPGTDLRPDQASTFEVDEENPEEIGIGDLEALIAAANDHSGDWSDGMSGVSDLPEMTRMWAVERYIGHWDGYAGRAWNETYRPNNYYLHSKPTGIFTMLPWGTDQTWGFDPAVGTRLSFGEPAGGRIFNYCYEDPSCKELYVKALEGIYFGVSGLTLDAHAAALAQMLAPYQAEEEAPYREFAADEIAKGVAETRKFIAERQGELAEYLFPKPPASALLQPALPRRAKIGSTRVRGAVVFTHLTAFAPGRAVQRVTARAGGHQVKGCTGKRVVHRARKLTVRCRLSGRARALLKEAGRLRLRVKVGFVAPAGGSPFRTRSLTLKRHP